LGGKERHFEFEPHYWHQWALALNENQAVVSYPPRTPEFNDLLEQLRNGGKTAKTRGIISDDLLRGLTLNVHPAPPPPDYYALGPTPRSRRYSDPSPQKPKKAKKLNNDHLEEIGYNYKDWYGRGLDDYFNWLQTTYSGLNFDDALKVFKRESFGLDMLLEGGQFLTPTFLISTYNLPGGVAVRTLNEIKNWVNGRLLEKDSE